MAAPGYQSSPCQGGMSRCVTRVELRIECKNLRNRDAMSKSDPSAILFTYDGHKFNEEGRTESMKNTLDPRFVRAFPLDYYFETVQRIKVAVYDIDNTTDSLKDDDFLGQIEVTLGQIVSGSPFTQPLLKLNGEKEGSSSITIRVEEVKEGSEIVEMLFKAKNLENKDGFLGKSDPFLQVSSRAKDGSLQVIWKTEVVKNNLNPQWNKFSLRVSTLCSGDPTKPIQFDVFDSDDDGSHDLIGSFTTTLHEMLNTKDGEVSWPCINPKKVGKKKYTNSGTAILSKCLKIKEFSFLDFVFGGLQINLSIAIDFTASNGEPHNPKSLHFMNPVHPNEYQQAINAVGHVVQDYDSDKLFPVLGFGARLPQSTEVSFEFAVNFIPNNPYCAGIQGVLQAYVNCIRQVELYGPTNVAPIIKHVAGFAHQAQQLEMAGKGAVAYFILLLLSDGAVTDVAATVDAIVHAAALPISLIIVGIGSADFSLMNFLDGDDGALKSSTGQRAVRDIVQFVPFRDFKNASPDMLARHVLAEIPGQVTQYFKMRGLPPNTPVTAIA